jgi:hypothetical protein
MAATSSFKQQCPSCEAMVPIRDPGLVGRKIDCPKCKYRFVVEAPEEEDEAPEPKPAAKGKPVPAGKTPAGKASAIGARKAAANGIQKPAAKAKSAAAEDLEDDDEEEARPKPKKEGGKTLLLVGGSLAVVAVIALGVGAFFLFRDSKPAKNAGGSQSRSGPMPSGGPGAPGRPGGPGSPTSPGGNPAANPKPDDKSKPSAETPVAVADITNLLPNDTEGVFSVPLKHLLESSVGPTLFSRPGAFNDKAFQAIFGIEISDVTRIVQAISASKDWVFTVMRTASPVKKETLIANLRLGAAQKVGEMEYYFLGRPLDSLSNVLLKSAKPRDKFTVHVMDSRTLVFADVGPMKQFLQDKGKPKALYEPPKAPSGPAMPGGGMPGGGMPGGMKPPPGGMAGGQGPPGGLAPPGGMAGGSLPPAGNGPPAGMAGGQPPSGFPPAGGMGGGGLKAPNGPASPGGGPQGPGGLAPGGGGPKPPGGSTSPGAAPAAKEPPASYTTIQPHLKAVLDAAEKTEKGNKDVLLSMAAEVGPALARLPALARNRPATPDLKLLAPLLPQELKSLAELKPEDFKAFGLGLVAINDTKAIVNVSVEMTSETKAGGLEDGIDYVLTKLVLPQTGLDLIEDTSSPNANAFAGNFQPGGSSRPGGMGGSMPSPGGLRGPGMGGGRRNRGGRGGPMMPGGMGGGMSPPGGMAGSGSPPGGMGGNMRPPSGPGGAPPVGSPPGGGAAGGPGAGGFPPPGGAAGGQGPGGFKPPAGMGGSFTPPGGVMPPGGMRPPGGMAGGFGPPGMGQPGMNPQGTTEENKGKDGKYILYSQDTLLFFSLDLSLPDALYQRIVGTLEEGMVYARGFAEMSNVHPRIHELAAAIQAYVKDPENKGAFPRGALHRSLSSERVLDWRPDQRLSWLVKIKDYLPGDDYSRLKVDEAKGWTDGDNRNVAMVPIPQFLAPVKSSNPFWYYLAYPGQDPTRPFAATHFVGVAGVGLDAAEYRAGDAAVAKKLGVFGYDRVTKLTDIKDGPENTIVALQVAPEHATPWMAGGGSTVRGISEEADCVQPFVCVVYQGKKGTFAIMADGRVRFIPADIAPDTFRALCTIAGGERIKNLDEIAPVVEGDEGPALKTGPLPAPPAAEAPKEAAKAPAPIVQGGQPAGAATFLDEEKEVPPRLEWNREVGSRQGGTFPFRVTSQGPFALTVVTDRGYKALQKGDRQSFKKEDVLLTVDSKGPTLDGEVTIPPGSSYFIIENHADKAVRLHLQCFVPKK